MLDREAEVVRGRQIQFRIGINLGDVIVEPEDIFGDSVNVAARLEKLAEPGGILSFIHCARSHRRAAAIPF
jgi:adenylate cyclase